MWGRLSSLAQTVQGIATEEEEAAEGATMQQPVCSPVYYVLCYKIWAEILCFSSKNLYRGNSMVLDIHLRHLELLIKIFLG